jgi:aldehyde dehydrogenase (NAD+)
MAHVNDQLVLDLPEQPMRGQKNSGIGRLNGAWAIEAFTTHQWITVQRSPQHHPLDARHVKGARAGG